MTVSPPAVHRLELILKCFDIWNTKESQALAPDQGFHEAAGETRGCGGSVAPLFAGFLQPPLSFLLFRAHLRGRLYDSYHRMLFSRVRATSRESIST